MHKDLQQLQRLLPQYDSSLAEDTIEFPVGYAQAFLICPQYTGGYVLEFIAWDRTGGISDDKELGLYESIYEVARAAVFWIDFYNKEADKLEAQLEAAFGPGE